MYRELGWPAFAQGCSQCARPLEKPGCYSSQVWKTCERLKVGRQGKAGVSGFGGEAHIAAQAQSTSVAARRVPLVYVGGLVYDSGLGDLTGSWGKLQELENARGQGH